MELIIPTNQGTTLATSFSIKLSLFHTAVPLFTMTAIINMAHGLIWKMIMLIMTCWLNFERVGATF